MKTTHERYMTECGEQFAAARKTGCYWLVDGAALSGVKAWFAATCPEEEAAATAILRMLNHEFWKIYPEEAVKR